MMEIKSLAFLRLIVTEPCVVPDCFHSINNVNIVNNVNNTNNVSCYSIANNAKGTPPIRKIDFFRALPEKEGGEGLTQIF